MRQVRTQSDGELFRGQLHAAQHSFDGVAVMAEQASGSVGVVAVVGSDLPSDYLALADATSVVLEGEKLLNLSLSHASSFAALSFKSFRPNLGIGSNLGILNSSSASALGAPTEDASAFAGLRGVAVFFASGLNLWAAAICSLLSASLFQVSEAAEAVRFKIVRPLFRAAIGFPHSAYATPNANGLNRAVILQGDMT